MGGGNAKAAGVEDGRTHGVVPGGANSPSSSADDGRSSDHENFFASTGENGQAAGDDEVEDATAFVFELIPFYTDNDPETAAQIVETLESVTAQGVSIDTRDSFGNTLLMMSVHHQKPPLVAWALSQGANIDAINFAGVCAMHIACHESSGSFELAQLLVKHGADLEIADSNGCTVLHYAASAGDQSLVSFLLNSGSNPNSRDVNNFMPIDYALESGSEQCASLLVDAKEQADTVEEALSFLDNDADDFNFSGRVTDTNFIDSAQAIEEGNWTEYIDGMSETPYYFNSVTGETTWEKPAVLQGKSSLLSVVSASQGHFDGSAGGDSLREIPEHIQEKNKKKKKRKKKKKTASDSDTDSGESSVTKNRAQKNLALWRRVAWRVGIKKVAAKKRRLAIQAAREAMMMEQHAIQEKRDAELKLKQAEEMRKRADQASSLQEQEIEKLREEFMRKLRELKEELEKERNKASSLDTKIKQKQREKWEEIKRREEESNKREAAPVAELGYC